MKGMKLRDGLSRVAEVFPLPFKCKILVENRWAAWVFKSGSSGRERSPWPTGETLTITGSKARLSMLSKMTDMASSTNTRFSRCCHKCYFTSLSPFKTFYPQSATLPGGLLRITAERWVHLTVKKDVGALQTWQMATVGQWFICGPGNDFSGGQRSLLLMLMPVDSSADGAVGRLWDQRFFLFAQMCFLS